MTSRPKSEKIDGSKLTLPLTAVVALIVPVGTSMASYFKSMSEMKQEMVQIRLEGEQSFAHKEDIKDVEKRLDAISADLSEIKGYLKRR